MEREETPDGDEYVRRWPISHKAPRPKDAGIWRRVKRGPGGRRRKE